MCILQCIHHNSSVFTMPMVPPLTTAEGENCPALHIRLFMTAPSGCSHSMLHCGSRQAAHIVCQCHFCLHFLRQLVQLTVLSLYLFSAFNLIFSGRCIVALFSIYQTFIYGYYTRSYHCWNFSIRPKIC